MVQRVVPFLLPQDGIHQWGFLRGHSYANFSLQGWLGTFIITTHVAIFAYCREYQFQQWTWNGHLQFLSITMEEGTVRVGGVELSLDRRPPSSFLLEEVEPR